MSEINGQSIEAIKSRLSAVKDRIEQASRRAGRDPNEVTLVAVSKTWSHSTILAAYGAGLRHFGENRPEELAEKRPQVEAVLGKDSGIVWHSIGDLQSRKTSQAAEHSDVFHALDRLKIARRLSRHMVELNRRLPVLLEVNVSGEKSKSGFAASVWEEDSQQIDTLCEIVDEISGLPGLDIRGLMTMAFWDAPETQIRDVFCRTRLLGKRLKEDFPDCDLSWLSMGMTGDFEVAIEEGATHVRIGRAIFGERQ